MSTNEKKTSPDQTKSTVPPLGAKSGAPKPPAPPTPQAPSENNIKDTDEMPDLAQYNFMKW